MKSRTLKTIHNLIVSDYEILKILAELVGLRKYQYCL
jgi:hypothetical protein